MGTSPGQFSWACSEQRRFLVERHLIDGFGDLVVGTSPLSFAGLPCLFQRLENRRLLLVHVWAKDPHLAQNGGVFAMDDVIAREQDPTPYDWLKDDGRFDFVAGLEGCGLNFFARPG